MENEHFGESYLYKENQYTQLIFQKHEVTQVMVKMTANVPKVLEILVKNKSHINHVFSTNFDSEIYMEPLQDAILFIFRDFDAFKTLMKPIPQRKTDLNTNVYEKICLNPNCQKLSRIWHLHQEKKLKGKGELHLYFSSDTHNIKELFPFINSHYESMHPDITVRILEGERIRVSFRSFRSYLANLTFMRFLTEFAHNRKKTSIEKFYSYLSSLG